MKKVCLFVVPLLVAGFCGVNASYAAKESKARKRGVDNSVKVSRGRGRDDKTGNDRRRGGGRDDQVELSRRSGDDTSTDDRGRGRSRDDNGQNDRGRGRGRGNGRRGKGGETRTTIALTGAAINGVTPEGHAEFRVRGTRLKFNVEVEDVNLPDDTVLTVIVSRGETVLLMDTLTLDLREGELELNSNDGNTVPTVQAGDVVTVTTADGTPVVSGQF